ncbi:hypothetical protein EDEG_02366 [Edhazardia aedis USNM 41457]|uniref:Uncharacterized protein n=1 Tax=Edhazardia aedis (strain USNM 41457) TaxID=1003232 RepID=J9D6X5_EDHAE|nr:hypothetical protein EDEG_02366 [Edhazardia aedis USNM 41457]|eukprot:EJW03274.1 hypothetical protein EDEG_02366 [Edhazardia aedis USNM 41457]
MQLLLSIFAILPFIASTANISIIPVPRGLTPGQTCRYYGYSDVIGSTQNISYLYNLLEYYNYPSAYIAAYNGDYSGVVLTNTGAIQPYNKFTNPTNYVFCQSGSMGITNEANMQEAATTQDANQVNQALRVSATTAPSTLTAPAAAAEAPLSLNVQQSIPDAVRGLPSSTFRCQNEAPQFRLNQAQSYYEEAPEAYFDATYTNKGNWTEYDSDFVASASLLKTNPVFNYFDESDNSAYLPGDFALHSSEDENYNYYDDSDNVYGATKVNKARKHKKFKKNRR